MNNFNNIKEVADSTFAPQQERIVTIAGQQVYYSQSTMTRIDRKLSVVILRPAPFNDRVIVVDTEFMKMSEEAQEFIIMHEVGHIVHEHIENTLIRQVCVWLGLVYKNEREADDFAVMALGADKVLIGLQEIADYVHVDSEVLNRIKRIKKGAK